MPLDRQRLGTLAGRLSGANYNTLAGLSKALFSYLEREAEGNPQYAMFKNQIPTHEYFKSANGATDGGFWTLPDNPESLAFALFYWIAHGEFYPIRLYPVSNFDAMISSFVNDFAPLLVDALNEILAAERPAPSLSANNTNGQEANVVAHHTHFHAPVGNVVTSPLHSTIHQQQVNYGLKAGDLESLLHYLREAKISEIDLAALSEAIKSEPSLRNERRSEKKSENGLGK